MAVNCCVAPAIRAAVAGDTAIEAIVLAVAVTVRLAVAVTPPAVTVMVVVPAATAVASPVALTVATVGFDEVQVAPWATALLFPSLKTALARSCWVAPTEMEAVGGVTVIDFMVTVPAMTLTCVEPVSPFKVAVMVESPAPSAVTMPILLTIATAESDDAQVTEDVRSTEVPSLYKPVAVT